MVPCPRSELQASGVSRSAPLENACSTERAETAGCSSCEGADRKIPRTEYPTHLAARIEPGVEPVHHLGGDTGRRSEALRRSIWTQAARTPGLGLPGGSPRDNMGSGVSAAGVLCHGHDPQNPNTRGTGMVHGQMADSACGRRPTDEPPGPHEARISQSPSRRSETREHGVSRRGIKPRPWTAFGEGDARGIGSTQRTVTFVRPLRSAGCCRSRCRWCEDRARHRRQLGIRADDS